MDRPHSEIIADFIKLVTECPKIYDAMESAVKREDLLCSDLLHTIELEGQDENLRRRTATALRINRLDRRYYKDRKEELEPLYNFLQDGQHRKAMKDLEQVLGKTRKAEAYHADRTYHPRVKKEV